LASFILRENKTQEDLRSAKRVMEKEAAKLAYPKMTADARRELNSYLEESTDLNHAHFAFFQYLFQKVENVLFAKIWYLMEEFSGTVDKHHYDQTLYTELIRIYADEQYSKIESL